MFTLEEPIASTLTWPLCVFGQKKYLGNLAFVNDESIEHVLQHINSFHLNIQFTYKLESNGKISSLDVILIQKNNNSETTLYRKTTKT